MYVNWSKLWWKKLNYVIRTPEDDAQEEQHKMESKKMEWKWET